MTTSEPSACVQRGGDQLNLRHLSLHSPGFQCIRPPGNGLVKIIARPATMLPNSPCIAKPTPTPTTPTPATSVNMLNPAAPRATTAESAKDEQAGDPHHQQAHRRLQGLAVPTRGPQSLRPIGRGSIQLPAPPGPSDTSGECDDQKVHHLVHQRHGLFLGVAEGTGRRQERRRGACCSSWAVAFVLLSLVFLVAGQ